MSQFQDEVRQCLEACFPHALIRENMAIVWEGQRLFVDFVLPHLGLAFEADGAQHEHYSEFFYDSTQAFRAAQRRDATKDEWAEQSPYLLVRIPWADRQRLSALYIVERIREAQNGAKEGNGNGVRHHEPRAKTRRTGRGRRQD